MKPETIFSLAGSGIFLALAALTAIRGSRRSALAVPTSFVCVDLWAYTSFEALSNLSDAAYWEWLESAAAAMAAPLLFHLTLTFLGQRRARRAWMIAAYVYFGAIALSCLAPLAAPRWDAYPGGDLWALLMLAGLLPLFGFAGWLLYRHVTDVDDPEERARSQLYIAAVLIGVGGPAADLAQIAGVDDDLPSIAAPALLLSALLLSALAMRARFIRGTLRAVIVNAVLIALVGVTAQVLVFRWLGGDIGFLVVGTIVVTLLLLAAARGVWRAYAETRERTAQLASLGRLGAQMAHDIRNPLAAIRGAAQYLDEERRRGGGLEEQGEFLDLILEQVDRLDRVVEDYQRLGAAKARLEDTDLTALVEEVAKRADIASDGVEIEARTDELGTLPADPELLRTALENLIRNAVEALGEGGGHVRVGGRIDEVEGRVVLSVEDDGPGMDARTREQAEEAFFTTKASGSGLGLAFARRVAEAHHGQLRVRSALGRGTTVELRLPRSRASLPG